MIIVRPARENDFGRCLTLIREFQDESLDHYGLWCDNKIASIIMQSFLGTSFVLDDEGLIVGVIAGKIVNYPLNNEKLFQEFIWFVNKEYRQHGIKLYDEMEKLCKSSGIKKIVMVAMANSKAQKLEQFYNRLGFELLEKHYIKNLGG